MNCKPNDLAVIVNDPECGQVDIGKIVRVIRLSEYGTVWCPEWVCDVLGQKLAYAHKGWDESQSYLMDIPDEYLRPIRDPGDEATDETLLWKPVPKDGELSKEDADLLIDVLKEWANQ